MWRAGGPAETKRTGRLEEAGGGPSTFQKGERKIPNYGLDWIGFPPSRRRIQILITK